MGNYKLTESDFIELMKNQKWESAITQTMERYYRTSLLELLEIRIYENTPKVFYVYDGNICRVKIDMSYENPCDDIDIKIEELEMVLGSKITEKIKWQIIN